MYNTEIQGKKTESIKVSEKLPTYPSPKPTLSLSSHLGQNVGLGGGGGYVGSFPKKPMPRQFGEERSHQQARGLAS